MIYINTGLQKKKREENQKKGVTDKSPGETDI